MRPPAPGPTLALLCAAAAACLLRPLAFAKTFSRCELAHELRYRHGLPARQVPTWVCIARFESLFNTSAVGRLNGGASLDHGLFQMSDTYWCSPPGRGTACGLSCDKLVDDDITDDVECALRVYREHQRLTGDGFNAWVVYQRFCSRGRADRYVDDCFEKPLSANAV